MDTVTVTEILVPRRALAVSGRGLLQVLDAWRDRRAIRRLLASLQESHLVTVLFESSKYGIIRTGKRLRSVAFIHNAIPHAASHMTIRDRILFFLERRMASQADMVAVHGERQAEVVAAWTATPVTRVPLPGDSRPVLLSPNEAREAYALCIGEIRPNKGIEYAIDAARTADIRLRVVGAAEPAGFADELQRTARGGRTSLELGYLDAGSFNSTLAAAAVVVLPYTEFAAQSGVLAKAMQYSRHVVASDLPSLREQGHGYPHIEYVPVGDKLQLGASMARAMGRASSASIDATSERRAWDDVARALFA